MDLTSVFIQGPWSGNADPVLGCDSDVGEFGVRALLQAVTENRSQVVVGKQSCG